MRGPAPLEIVHTVISLVAGVTGCARVQAGKGHKAGAGAGTAHVTGGPHSHAALHVSAGGVLCKPHTAHGTTAAGHAAQQAKAHAAEARRGARNGSDSGSNSPDEDGVGPEA